MSVPARPWITPLVLLIRTASHVYVLRDVFSAFTGVRNGALAARWNGIKKRATGVRNAELFKTTIYVHCSNLDLCPRETR